MPYFDQKNNNEKGNEPAYEGFSFPFVIVDSKGNIIEHSEKFIKLVGEEEKYLFDEKLKIQNFLESPTRTFKELYKKAGSGEGIFLKLKGLNKNDIVVFTYTQKEGENLRIIFLPYNSFVKREETLKLEIRRLENLFEEICLGENKQDLFWFKILNLVLENLPWRAVLLNKKTEIIIPLFEDTDKPKCYEYLLNEKDKCKDCILNEALEKRKLVEKEFSNFILHAKPLLGGYVLEWKTIKVN